MTENNIGEDMDFAPLTIAGLILIKPRVYGDDRGFFLERYNQRTFAENGIEIEFVQDNHSQSTRHVLRGLHFQVPPFAQDKLVWVVRGTVFDVAVDLRPDSPTFGQWHGVTLSEQNKHMFLIPRGFAHGFVAQSERVDFCYKASAFYSKTHDQGIIWNDPDIGIEWPVTDPILSKRDQGHPRLKDLQ